jgi:hypothetical protein
MIIAGSRARLFHAMLAAARPIATAVSHAPIFTDRLPRIFSGAATPASDPPTRIFRGRVDQIRDRFLQSPDRIAL